jgi:cytochrome b6-f complex iron-sulfur subunit
MENVTQSRRKFLTTVALLLGLGGLLRYLTPRVRPRRQVVLTAALNDIPPDGALVFQEQRVVLLRDAGGPYALSLVCTHLGCTVTVSAREMSCPCHGSRFDRQGRVLNGPADRPLKRHAVEEKSGMIEVLA